MNNEKNNNHENNNHGNNGNHGNNNHGNGPKEHTGPAGKSHCLVTIYEK